MKPRVSALLIVSVCLSFSQAVFSQTKVTSVEGITEYRLDNGLKVLLFPDNSKPTVTVNVTYLVGSRHEGYGETGMAHLLEHMMFRGSTKHPDVKTEIRDHGANFNGISNAQAIRAPVFIRCMRATAPRSSVTPRRSIIWPKSWTWNPTAWSIRAFRGRIWTRK